MVRAVEQTLGADFPPVISFADGAGVRPGPVAWPWSMSAAFLQMIGLTLRNNFYLPLMKQSVDQESATNQKLAGQVTAVLSNPGVSCSKKLETIRRCFSMRDIDVRLEGSVVRIFTVRLFESNMPIAGKKLRVILFCFNGNRELTAEGHPRLWDPLRIDEVSTSPLSVLRAFQASGLRVDSVITNSLGNLIFDGLKYLPPGVNAAEIMPQTLVINRGFTSVKKVGDRLFPFPLNCVLYNAAKLTGWDADAEEGLLNFCNRISEEAGPTSHQVVIIKALEDYYFSGKGALDSDTPKKIDRLGFPTFFAEFWPYPFHSRSHHAITLNHLKNNSETGVHINTDEHFRLDEGEKMSTAIARNIFFRGEAQWHTSYCTGGSDATLDIGTVREVMPLLSAFVHEGNRRVFEADDLAS